MAPDIRRPTQYCATFAFISYVILCLSVTLPLFLLQSNSVNVNIQTIQPKTKSGYNYNIFDHKSCFCGFSVDDRYYENEICIKLDSLGVPLHETYSWFQLFNYPPRKFGTQPVPSLDDSTKRKN